MKLKDIAASASDTIKITYLPQYLVIVGASVSTNPPDIKITVQGDGVICDLDADGTKALDGIRAVRNASLIQIALADGIVSGKNVEIYVNNNATATISVYEYSLKKGTSYVRSMRATVFANTQAKFEDFAFLAIPLIGSSDLLSVTYVDGHNQQLSDQDLLAQNAYNQGVDSYALDNLDALIDEALFLPTADRTVYKVDFLPVGNIV